MTGEGGDGVEPTYELLWRTHPLRIHREKNIGNSQLKRH